MNTSRLSKSNINILSKAKLHPDFTSSTFLTSSTDDISFASNQVEKINKKIFLQEYYHKKPWNKDSNNNIFLENGKSNFMLLNEVKKKLLRKQSLKDINWHTHRYFNENQFNKVLDASHIVKQHETRKEVVEPYIDIHTYKKQSKEICINNMLISILNEERTKIQQKQQSMTNALVQSHSDLDNDMSLFDSFKDDMRKQTKENEIYLSKVALYNRQLLEVKKKCMQDHRLILDEIEKTIRQIITQKYYAVFVHSLLGNGHRFIHSNVPDKIEIKYNREIELTEYAEQIYNDMKFIVNNTSKAIDMDVDTEKIINIFDQSENNIIRLIKLKEEYDIERNNIILANRSTIDELQKKYELHEQEYNACVSEVDDLKKQINDAHNNANVDEFLLNAMNYVVELDEAIVGAPFKSKDNLPKMKLLNEILDRSVSRLRKLECNINAYLQEIDMNEKENSELFNKCIEERKKANKLLRYFKEKELLSAKQNEQAKNLHSKLKLFVFKGRKKYAGPVPLHILKHRTTQKAPIKDTKEEQRLIDY